MAIDRRQGLLIVGKRVIGRGSCTIPSYDILSSRYPWIATKLPALYWNRLWTPADVISKAMRNMTINTVG